MWRSLRKQLAKPSLLGFAVTMLVPAVLMVLLIIRILGANQTLNAASTSISTSKSPSFSGPTVGQVAPDFSLAVWNGASGQKVSLASLKGKPVAMNFWASWCDPCQQEAPVLEQAWHTYAPHGIVFLGAAIGTSQSDGMKFLQQHGISYPCGSAPDAVSVSYGIVAIPVTVLINSKGSIVQIFRGPLDTTAFNRAMRALS